MKPSGKDIIYVGIQLMLFALYAFPPFRFALTFPETLIYLAWISGALGMLICLFALLQLNRNLTPFPTPKKHGNLITSGVYGYVRHPIYSGILVATLGFGLFSGDISRFLIGILLWILFYYKTGYEEELLENKYPKYASYRESTGRLFPQLK